MVLLLSYIASWRVSCAQKHLPILPDDMTFLQLLNPSTCMFPLAYPFPTRSAQDWEALGGQVGGENPTTTLTSLHSRLLLFLLATALEVRQYLTCTESARRVFLFFFA
ncbi:hypothetical protein QBC36DRAFT_323544 [Triangularia setosa]|uniref:Secreted protein n=1 Tax=Triangularia setosa TaxID=2587417 RepID=A0AAN7AAZ0_9PEZI|nr:hypothetical protein QBC36DRAFT_323544 [Podospora setosa]